MKEERLDKLIRDKIEQLVPSGKSAGLNKQASWQKLDTMLQPQPKGKAWMYYAAAIVLILSPILFIYKQDGRANRIAVKGEVTHKNTKPKQELSIKGPVPSIAIKNEKGQAAVKHNTQSAKDVTKSPLMPLKDRIQEIGDSNNASDSAISIVINMATPSDRAAIATTALPKKKLKVVHLNEIEEQPSKTETAKQNFTVKAMIPLFGSGAQSFFGSDGMQSSDATSLKKKQEGLFKASLSN